jgi:cyclohexa-1,5-dienecarbonyl-CoA hydratase
MEKIKINYLHNETVLQIVFDDGKGNVIDSVMMEDLQKLFRSIASKEHIKMIIFEGQGKHFSFGASVEEHKKEFAEIMIKNFHQLFYTIKELSIPTMARISGQCLGGGLELALMCNFLFCDKSAVLGQPEIVLGVFPPPASLLLPLKIGYARAEELLITGKTITADEAFALGLINKVFENKESLQIETDEWINKLILPKSASSLRYAVKASRIKFNHILSNFLPQLEHLYVHQLMNTKDANEGINSFLEKRKPVWSDA